MIVSRLRVCGLAFVFLWFLIGGIGHFAFTNAFLRIVPPYLPFPLAAVWVSGFFEILGAVVLCIPRFRRLAGFGLIALTVFVTPANIYMWRHPELFSGIPEWILGSRLVVQVLLITVIAWATRARDLPTENT